MCSGVIVIEVLLLCDVISSSNSSSGSSSSKQSSNNEVYLGTETSKQVSDSRYQSMHAVPHVSSKDYSSAELTVAVVVVVIIVSQKSQSFRAFTQATLVLWGARVPCCKTAAA
jgi:hypothetical protein